VIGKYINDNVTSKITVTPEEAAEYYKSHTEEFRHPDMVRTSHILIMVTEGATAEQDRLARQRAEAILARARKGEDFAKLAQETSMDSSASQGGDIGYVTPGQVDPAYQAAAFSLAVGALSDPVRSRVGYHIIKVTDKKKEGIATLDESRVQLTEFLKNQKSDRQLQQLVDQLRKEAKIEILITAGAPPTASPTASSPRP
jgi:parvulin-like peptidyl-prolyl isomerase